MECNVHFRLKKKKEIAIISYQVMYLTRNPSPHSVSALEWNLKKTEDINEG